jgi:hypothetical protein
MTLDEQVKKIMAEGKGSILVVDNICDIDAEQNQTYNEHIRNEENCEVFASQNGVKLNLWDMGRKRVFNSEEYRLRNFRLVLVRAKSTHARFGLRDEASLLAKIITSSPDSEIVYCIPDIDQLLTEASKNSLRMVFEHILGKKITVEPVNYDCFPTLMHYLSFVMTGKVFYKTHLGMSAFTTPRSQRDISATQHNYKNRMWQDFYVSFIDKSLRAGNSQTEQKYHFLILSDREINNLGNNTPSAPEKVAVKPANYVLNENDLNNCAAIFIDNEWSNHAGALGEGIKTLRRIRKQLGSTNIPIIYVTGHDLAKLSEEETEEIRQNGAVIAGKDSFPKVATREKAEKEIKISGMLETSRQLARYTVRIMPELIGRNDSYVICSKIAEETEDPAKKELFAGMGIEDEIYNHRMYVLGLWHETMKGKQFEAMPLFRTFDELSSRCRSIEKHRALYEEILKNPDLHDITTIAHNDAKDDNWFGKILGDYGDVSAGNEYKDIARALMGSECARDKEWTREKTMNYLKLRGIKTDEERFLRNVCSMIFVEALREGSKKHDQELLRTADIYARIISPIRGE